MMIDEKVMGKIYQYLFYALCLFYILIYMPFGYEGTDTGYIFGTSWNIYNGQLPHRDFIYTRPAIPAYLHTVFIVVSENYGMLLERSFFYIQVFLYSFLGAKLICQHFSLRSKHLLYFLAIVGAMISIHNYPPMGWNTIDGVFFCVLGLYLLLKDEASRVSIFFGCLCMVLGTFSKQSFYFMPIFLFLYLLLRRDFYRLKYYTLFGLFWVLGYVGFKMVTNSLAPFIDQTFIRTPASGLLNSGVKTYYLVLKSNILYILGGVIAGIIAVRFVPKKYVYLLLTIGICLYMGAVFLDDKNAWTIVKNLFQIWLVGILIFGLVKSRKDRRYGLLLLLLAVSWSASISNGYRTPIHFSLPLVAGLYLLFFSSGKDRMPSWVSGTSLLLFLAVFLIGYQTIYRDAERNELTYTLGGVFPQLKFIKSDKETHDKLVELKRLASKYPNFTVLPSMTRAHYLTKTINPIGTDWPLDVEINGEARRLFDTLVQKKTVIFMETSEFTQKELEGYEIIPLIEEQWTLIAQTTYFKIYTSPSND